MLTQHAHLLERRPPQSHRADRAAAATSSVNDYIVPGGRMYEQRDFVYDALNSDPRRHRGQAEGRPFYIFPKLDVKKLQHH